MPKKNSNIPNQWMPLVETFIHRNSQINLSAIREAHDIYIKHIVDSLELCTLMAFKNNSTVLDLWTWGWFPLLPLAIENPKVQFIWLDARKKKCLAIDNMTKELWISNVTTHRGRAEEATYQVDIVTSRAVTFADQLMHRSLPLIKPWGLLVLYKLFTEEEDNAILSLTRRYNLTLKKLHHYHLPHDETQRILYILKK